MVQSDNFGQMTERELLVALYKDVQLLNFRVEAIKCPSPMCLSHSQLLNVIDDRLTKVETIDETKDKIHERSKRDRYIIWGLASGAVGLICTIIGMLVG